MTTGELKEQNNDTIFQDAVDALRRGDKPRAKELLTLLLKTDQNNATYWIWLSAAMDSQKERVYCLQTALKLDPENATAKRGLILLGALTPDSSVQPFPVNRPRAWEANLLLANEKPKEKGLRGIMGTKPVPRIVPEATTTVEIHPSQSPHARRGGKVTVQGSLTPDRSARASSPRPCLPAAP